jgi:hypothetical protein
VKQPKSRSQSIRIFSITALGYASILFWRWKKNRNNPAAKPPGIVINHSPARSGKYIGSPSIAVLPNGEYVASHDYFRRNRLGLCPQNEMVIFGSNDRGKTWQKHAELKGFWQNLFVHKGELYLMGVTRENGHLIIRRSSDRGFTWTEPTDKTNGILLDDQKYHTAPVPMVVHHQRIWRAMESLKNGTEWGKCFRAFVLSAPVDSDLLKAESWTGTNHIARDADCLNGDFWGWLEGNAVVALDGGIVNILRVDLPHQPEKAAIMTVSTDGTQADFDPGRGFIDFPGGAKKFTIRFDQKSGCYWSLVNTVKSESANLKPIAARNTLALSRSVDLREWEIRAILLEHPDVRLHAFQYADWLFDGDDMIAVVRTAYDDPEIGASSAHDANYLTFHRFKNFRSL